MRGKEIKDTKGVVRKTPSWDLVMQYEQAVRDKAAEFMNEGSTPVGKRYDIVAALKAARECSETRTWEFIEKVQLEPNSLDKERDSGRPDKTPIRKRSRSREPIAPKKKTKGGGKGKGRNALPNNNQVIHSKHNSKPICFKCNKKGGCDRSSCNMTHVCQVCFATDHGLHSCPNKA